MLQVGDGSRQQRYRICAQPEIDNPSTQVLSAAVRGFGAAENDSRFENTYGVGPDLIPNTP